MRLVNSSISLHFFTTFKPFNLTQSFNRSHLPSLDPSVDETHRSFHVTPCLTSHLWLKSCHRRGSSTLQSFNPSIHTIAETHQQSFHVTLSLQSLQLLQAFNRRDSSTLPSHSICQFCNPFNRRDSVILQCNAIPLSFFQSSNPFNPFHPLIKR